MIVHSLLVLGAFFGCIYAPFYVASITVQEDDYKPDPRDLVDKTDTFFLKG